MAEKAEGEELQRLWQTAENYFKAFPKAQLTAAVLYNWGRLCQKRGNAATDTDERKRWFNEATEKYRRATEAAPNYADSWGNWGNLCAQRGIAATNNQECEFWFNEAAEKYRKATEADPNHATNWFNWGVLCQNKGANCQTKVDTKNTPSSFIFSTVVL